MFPLSRTDEWAQTELSSVKSTLLGFQAWQVVTRWPRCWFGKHSQQGPWRGAHTPRCSAKRSSSALRSWELDARDSSRQAGLLNRAETVQAEHRGRRRRNPICENEIRTTDETAPALGVSSPSRGRADLSSRRLPLCGILLSIRPFATKGLAPWSRLLKLPNGVWGQGASMANGNDVCFSRLGILVAENVIADVALPSRGTLTRIFFGTCFGF